MEFHSIVDQKMLSYEEKRSLKTKKCEDSILAVLWEHPEGVHYKDLLSLSGVPSLSTHLLRMQKDGRVRWDNFLYYAENSAVKQSGMSEMMENDGTIKTSCDK